MSGPREQQQVADATLRLRISSYEEAVELVILGEPIIIVNDKMQVSNAKTQTPIRFSIRRLLHNASIASSATWLAGWLAGLPACNYRHHRKLHLALCIDAALC